MNFPIGMNSKTEFNTYFHKSPKEKTIQTNDNLKTSEIWLRKQKIDKLHSFASFVLNGNRKQ